MEKEEWKDIDGFEGFYQVSNLGRVKSLSRQVSKYEFRQGKLLKPKKIRSVYKVGLSNKFGLRRDYRIDVLVAKGFVEGFEEGKIVTHIDNDIANNRADNLRLIELSDYTNYTERDDLPSEEWKDIEGFEGKYQISNLGRVRSMPRFNNSALLKGSLIKGHLQNNGYLSVSLGGKSFLLHRLVAKAFCAGYMKGLVVNHIDENKQNNNADNLEWVTPEYNSTYGTAIGRAKKKQMPRFDKMRKKKLQEREKKQMLHQQEAIYNYSDDEVWVDIPDYEGLYQISSWGRVKSLPKRHPNVQGGYYMTKERFLCPRKHTNGYLNVQLCKDGKRGNHYVHRLVAIALLKNDRPDVYKDVNHINEDKTDNRLCNLEWCAHEYNALYGTKNERMLRRRKEERTMQKIVEKKNISQSYGAEKPVLCIDDDGCVVKEFRSLSAASRETGISVSKICQCCKGQRNKTGGFHWQYSDIGD